MLQRVVRKRSTKIGQSFFDNNMIRPYDINACMSKPLCRRTINLNLQNTTLNLLLKDHAKNTMLHRLATTTSLHPLLKLHPGDYHP